MNEERNIENEGGAGENEGGSGLWPLLYAFVGSMAFWTLVVLVTQGCDGFSCDPKPRHAGSPSIGRRLAEAEDGLATPPLSVPPSRDAMRQPGEPTAEEEYLAALEGLTDISTAVRDEPPRTKREE